MLVHCCPWKLSFDGRFRYVGSGFDTSNSHINFKAQLQELKKIELKIYKKSSYFDHICSLSQIPHPARIIQKWSKNNKLMATKPWHDDVGLKKVLSPTRITKLYAWHHFWNNRSNTPWGRPYFRSFWSIFGCGTVVLGSFIQPGLSRKCLKMNEKWPQGHDMMIWELKNRLAWRRSKSWPRISSFLERSD